MAVYQYGTTDNNYTTSQSATWDLVVETAFDRAVDFYLQSTPFFRDVADKRPVQQAMPGDSVVFTIHNKFGSLATTALAETYNPDPMPAVPPTRVTVTLAEYGAYNVEGLKLKTLAFTHPDQELVTLLARHQADTIDQLVLNVIQGGTNKLVMSAGSLSSSAANSTVAATDKISGAMVGAGVQKMRGRNVSPKIGDAFALYLHPDVTADLMADSASATAWSNPHIYSDPEAIYRGQVGMYRGAVIVESPRCPILANAGSGGTVNVYYGFLAGQQALAEAVAIEPHTVIGPVADALRRFYPLGWHSLIGWSVYRQEALTRFVTASSIAALT